MRKWEWTEPYYGVSHLSNIPKSHQITVTEHVMCTTVYMLHRHGPHPFTAVKKAVAKTVDEAKQVAEAWAEELVR